MKKYIAIGSINWLGTRHDTIEDAVMALALANAVLDSWTGYCSVFHKFDDSKYFHIFEYDDEHIVTKEEYEQALAEEKKAKAELEEEIRKLREERLGKYWKIAAVYHNQVPYQENDRIRVTARSKTTNRKKVYEGRVYDSVINEDGELRPALANDQRYIPATHYIEKIEVIGNCRKVPNDHCTHYDHYNDGKHGQCSHYDKENNKCKLLEEYLKKRKG